MVYYLLKDEEGIQKYDRCLLLQPDQFKAFRHPMKQKMIQLLSAGPLYVAEIAAKLSLNEQNVYYHLKDILPLLDVVEEKKIRGTVARKYALKASAFCLSYSHSFKDFASFGKKAQTAHQFFQPFVSNNVFSGKIIVGSPDVHGQYKARARDGHYAIDLSMYFGSFASLPKHFTVSLDVDVTLQSEAQNLVVVGGPVTNKVMHDLNTHLPVQFVADEHWAIKGKKETYNDDNVGLIARIPHPHTPDAYVLVVAGVRYSGTKAAVLALTRFTKLVLSSFTNQKTFYAVIQGFDLDGDGKIDSIDLLESS